tara:strand:+ start:1137 stop:1628 length:492 start_codon:yes stop_codon:yes gene_type:complete
MKTKRKIAIVEDNIMFANILANHIQEEYKAETSIYTSADQFMESNMKEYDLLILDYYLNISDYFAPSGEKVLKSINSTDIKLPIILLSDLNEPAKVSKLMREGVSQFVKKDDRLFLRIIESISEIMKLKDSCEELDKNEFLSHKLSLRMITVTSVVLVLLMIL